MLDGASPFSTRSMIVFPVSKAYCERSLVHEGTVATETCAEIFKKQLEITCKHYEEKLARRAKARAIARKQGKPFTEAERIAAQKAAEEAAKAAEEAAKKAAEEAKAGETTDDAAEEKSE